MDSLSRTDLKDLISTKQVEIKDLKLKTVTDAGNKAGYDQLIEDAKAELAEYLTALGKKGDEGTPVVQGGQQEYAYQCCLSNLGLEIKSIKRFEPGVMVETFAVALENLYMLQVAPKLTTWPSLESEFVTLALST